MINGESRVLNFVLENPMPVIGERELRCYDGYGSEIGGNLSAVGWSRCARVPVLSRTHLWLSFRLFYARSSRFPQNNVR